jgi:Tfp pilus assembly protein PilF
MSRPAPGGLAARIRAKLEQATALHRAGNLAQAKAAYEDILRVDPRQADALHLLAVVAGQTGDFAPAVELFGQAIALEPGNAAFHCNLGNAQKELGQAQAAMASYDRALALKPDYAEAWSNRGNALLGLQQFEAAIASYERAIAIKPELAEAHANRGFALQELNRLEAAVAAYDTAIALRPNYVPAFTGRGYARQRMLQLDAAIADYERAIAIDPRDAEAHWHKSLALLLGGHFEQGLALYEWRWRRRHLRPRAFAQPAWLGGGPLQGRTILLHGEQGLGDTIQFCRYASLVAARGARVIMEVPGPLLGLLRGLEGVSQWVEKGAPLPAFDCHCPLLSLPLACGTRLESIPARGAYLRSDPAKVNHWAARLGPWSGRRVGIAWSGSAAHQNDLHRSLALSELVVRLPPQYRYFSLQKDLREHDQATLRQHPQILHFGDELKDFADTAALCALMDLVVSVDTSLAHLAAALGKPTWILLPHHPDWRWLLHREDSPWYYSARLFRQGSSGDWGGVLEKLHADLRALPA